MACGLARWGRGWGGGGGGGGGGGEGGGVGGGVGGGDGDRGTSWSRSILVRASMMSLNFAIQPFKLLQIAQ